MFQLDSVSKTFQRADQKVEAVRAVDLKIEKGDFVQISGRSGSGKSTLLSLMAGLLTPDVGKLMLLDASFSDEGEEKRAYLRNFHMGIVPQQSTLLQSLTVLENVVLPWYLYPRSGDPYGRGRFLLDKLGIRALEKAWPSTLSGGEAKRVLIARALMNNPELILADEPTADLDPSNTHAVMELFRMLNEEGHTLVVVTHEMDTLSYGSRLLNMRAGVLEEVN